MTLQQLKNSLSRFPADLDDSEILLLPGSSLKSATLLAFTAYILVEDKMIVALGSPEAVNLTSQPKPSE
jgi:hypothetical protein